MTWLTFIVIWVCLGVFTGCLWHDYIVTNREFERRELLLEEIRARYERERR